MFGGDFTGKNTKINSETYDRTPNVHLFEWKRLNIFIISLRRFFSVKVVSYSTIEMIHFRRKHAPAFRKCLSHSLFLSLKYCDVA